MASMTIWNTELDSKALETRTYYHQILEGCWLVMNLEEWMNRKITKSILRARTLSSLCNHESRIVDEETKQKHKRGSIRRVGLTFAFNKALCIGQHNV